MHGPASRLTLTLQLLTLTAACSGGGSSEAPRSSAPVDLTVTDLGSEVQLAWTATAGASEYRVYQASTPGVAAEESALVETTTATQVTLDLGAAAAVAYFTLTALVGGQESFPAQEVTNRASGVDPLFEFQWHLDNPGSGNASAGEDVNVLPVWTAGITGTGVRVVIVDEDLQIAHPDLAPNVSKERSYNYFDASNDPTAGEPSGRHGTACAGIVAAARNNELGGSGAAPGAELIGYSVLQNLTTATEQDAMTRGASDVWVSSNSWGAVDGLGTPQPAFGTWKAGVDFGTTNGRSGLGTLYFWAAGNGGSQGVDDSNLDGRAAYHGVIAVGAVNSQGRKASYSEAGANLWICAPSSDSGLAAITTADRTGTAGYNTGFLFDDYDDPDYTRTFGGTSASTPLAAGVAALVLQANPGLGWRDVRRILALTARQNDPGDPGWQFNRGGTGVPFNRKYGFGVVDAQAAVALAQATTTNLPALRTVASATRQVDLAIPDNDATGVTDELAITGSSIERIEYVDVLFDASDHLSSADLEVELTSPSGTSTLLIVSRSVPLSAGTPEPFSNYTFGCAHLLDEPADGPWTLTVRDLAPSATGTFVRWAITVHGH